MLVRATMPRKCVAYGEAQEKHTAAVTLPSRFFPSSLWGLERARSPYLFLYSDVMDCSGKRPSLFPARGINTV